MRLEFHLTLKNCLSGVVGVCVVLLAVIPLFVPADHLGWLRWKTAIVALAAGAIVALFFQIAIQSHEDHQREAKEKQRDERDQRLETFLAKYTPTPPVQIQSPLAAATDTEDELYIELYQPTFVYPKVGDLAFKLLEGKYLASGKKAEDAVTECDFVVELYIVNKSAKKVHVREFAAWMEIAGEWRKLHLDDDFQVDDLWAGSVEYGLETKNTGIAEEPVELPRLVAKRNAEIRPGEPIEGWLKFTVPDINPNREYPIRIAVIDSIGKEHYVDKAVKKERQIGLRRVRR